MPTVVLTLSMFLAFLLGSQSSAQDLPGGASRQLQQTATVSSWPGEAKRWALVMGVDQYQDGNISPLRGAANDAGNLARALTQYAGFPSDQVVLLASDQPETRQPTRINILAYLSNIASAVPKDGLLLVAFAGHGLERGGKAYLIPSDARLTDDVSLLEESAISVERMHNRIRSANVAQVVVLLDACRNDPGGRADAPNLLTASYTRGFNFDVRNREVQAFATLYATAIGQRAFEYQEKKQGYFTWAVVEGLKGAAANDRGEVTLSGLVKYVQDVVPKRILVDLGASKQQRPFAVIEGYRADDLVVAVVVPPGATKHAGNTKKEASASVVNPEAVEQEYWETIRNSNDPQDYNDYLKAYPNGTYAVIARAKLRQIATARSKEPAASQLSNSQSSIGANNRPNVNSTVAMTSAPLRKSFRSQHGIEMVYIAPGSFMMGSNIHDDENPIHKVTIDYSFYIGRYEVTQGQWEAVMGNNPSYFKDCGVNCPVEQVSWNDAQRFINKLNESNDEFTYRLPSEAEWEYASRAGTSVEYAEIVNAMAWFSENSEGGPHAVGQKQPNAWGLADMLGNVWEWCQDWYHNTYYDAPTDGNAWLSGGEQKGRILRGESWMHNAANLRSAYRGNPFSPSSSNLDVGFRVVAVVRTKTR